LLLDWRLILRPFGWWTPVLSLVLGIAALATFSVIISMGERGAVGSRKRRFLVEDDRSGAHLAHVFPGNSGREVAAAFIGPACFACAVPCLFSSRIPFYFAVGLLGPMILFWLPAISLFSRAVRFYPYRPNVFIDMYDDPRSKQWLARPVDDESRERDPRDAVGV
jgi:hypothetical protein